MTQIEGIRPDDEFERIIDRSQLIGEGTGRRVYGVIGNQDIVIKESKLVFHQANFTEWAVWGALEKMGEDIVLCVQNPDLKDLFARTFAISYSARYLAMQRLSPLGDTPMPSFATLPFWFNDKKPSAFGKDSASSVKIIDYGMVDLYDALNPKNRQGIFG